jgi:protein Hikeshi
VKVSQDTDLNKAFAQKVAQNLFNYMTSFGEVCNNDNQLMTVPTNIFNRWYEKFTVKYDKDPNFVYRTTE